MFKQISGDNRCDHLRGHREGIVVSRIFTHIAGGSDLHHHGEGVDVDCRPSETDDPEEDIHRHMIAVIKRGAQITERQQRDADQYCPLASDMAGNRTDGNIADNRGNRRYHQTVGIAAVFHAPDMCGIA